MKTRHQQRGFGLLAFTSVTLLVIFFGILAFRLGPVYLEYFSVSSSLKAVQSDTASLGSEEPSQVAMELRQRLYKHMQINGVERANNDNIHITQTDKGYELSVAYEVKVPLLYNISALMTFDKKVLINTHGKS
jgi:hypothetical protein